MNLEKIDEKTESDKSEGEEDDDSKEEEDDDTEDIVIDKFKDDYGSAGTSMIMDRIQEEHKSVDQKDTSIDVPLKVILNETPKAIREKEEEKKVSKKQSKKGRPPRANGRGKKNSQFYRK